MVNRLSIVLIALTEAYCQYEHLTPEQAIQAVERKIGYLTRREKKEIAYHVECKMERENIYREEDISNAHAG